MKKLLLCFLSLLVNVGVWAQTYTSGVWEYTVSNDQATITGTTLTSGNEINIPSEIDGYPVVAIGDRAFSRRSDLIGPLTIPNSVTKIGRHAFYSCHGLTSLTILSSVIKIEDYAFQNCSSLTSLTIRGSVTAIGNWAFGTCRSLTGPLTIPNGVKEIGRHAFYSCRGLTGPLVIPDGVTTIGVAAFQDCPGLTGSLTIPSSVTKIGDYAFEGCRGLESVVFERKGQITTNLSSGEVKMFGNCSSLRYIDASGVDFIFDNSTASGVSFNKPNYTLLYLPENGNSQLNKNTENVIFGSVCKNFKVYENAGYGADGYGQRGYEYGTAIRESFTAENASYSGKKLTDDDVYSLYLPYETTLPEGVEAYRVSNYRSGERVMVFAKHTGKLNAYTPYLLRQVAGSGRQTLDGITMQNVQVNTAPSYLTNQNGGSVQDTDGNTWKFLGTTNPIDNATAVANRLYVLEPDNTWRPVLTAQSSGHVRSLRAFLQAPEGESGAPLAFMLDEGEAVTGLDAVETEVQKGQADIYTIEGRFVGHDYESLPRGLYVIGGKKVYKF